ncbi:hypothetical protein [Mammaliicoccus stepanovicii]|uniref:Uncharacterized protein n=1 Tax=Mammaliicoccus stepanovicii TaxID=643214 RepID=A0A239ZVZ8_9STAP|nr:hypothetical protein [Mammaliicoccus stepanovicii]PNZ79272.1 hypothetical protein CD111_00095 [Mammaliicoccus stepanovicii]GGI39129.1 hypothetical protein GCM10010896_01840 [Mammaliicoccus stepanovicii]SNV75412.1 Uncharacterised protein [Mammaliicoccus stepanovicii]
MGKVLSFVDFFEVLNLLGERPNNKISRFLKLSEEIMLSIVDKQKQYENEIKWFNNHFERILKEIYLLNNEELCSNLLDITNEELEVIKSFDENDETKIFIFIDILLSMDDNIEYINNNTHIIDVYKNESYEVYNPDVYERVAM